MTTNLPVVQRSEMQSSTVTVHTKDALGLSLGDLRSLVDAADGIADEAVVTVWGLEESVVRIHEKYVKTLIVRDERRTS